jgi:large subunit ribosomal protein L9
VKIVLRADVEHLGRKGDLLEVTDGYARNYLVPRGMAIKATKGAVAQAEAMRRNRAARDTRDREGADAVAAQLGARPLRVLARAGEGGKLFGSVTNADLAAAVHEQLGIDVDRRAVELAEPIRDLGATDVEVRLHPEVTATLHVEVVAE